MDQHKSTKPKGVTNPRKIEAHLEALLHKTHLVPPRKTRGRERVKKVSLIEFSR